MPWTCSLVVDDLDATCRDKINLYFSQHFPLHKYCRVVLDGDSDSASNSASESILPTARQYLLLADN
jgi:hypothetical protein